MGLNWGVTLGLPPQAASSVSPLKHCAKLIGPRENLWEVKLKHSKLFMHCIPVYAFSFQSNLSLHKHRTDSVCKPHFIEISAWSTKGRLTQSGRSGLDLQIKLHIPGEQALE